MVTLTKSATEFELSPTLEINEIVRRRRARGEPVVHLGFGQSPFPVPERLQQSLKDNVHCNEYLPTAGLEELREAAALYYRKQAGLDTAQYEVLVTPGSKLVLYALQMAVQGDLLIPVPSWVSYGPQAKMLHTEVIKFPAMINDEGYHIDTEILHTALRDARAAGKNPSKLILNYPNNPTGLSIPENELEEIAALCREENILIVSDEIYGLVSFEEGYRSISRFAPDITAVTTGLSKHLSLGGWRLGIGLIPKAVEGLQQALCNIASEMWSCVPAPIQQAAIVAYQGHEDLERYIQDCNAIHSLMNRYLAKELAALGINAPPPQGAFYNYPDFSALRPALNACGIVTSKDLAAYLLKEYGLSALPGVAFGADPENLTLRLSACDYDGGSVLAAYHAGEVLDEAFIIRHAPQIADAVKIFRKFVKDIAQKAA